MPESEATAVTTHKTNIPEFSVGDLAQTLKRTIEDQFGRVRVRGELSRVSIAGSGHMYSSLKDDQAVIDAVCWKGQLSKLSIKPEEGLEVICTGRLTTYPKSSKYQLVIESMELAGEGALLKMLEERRKKLSAEGLFDEDRKQELPFLPQTIGVVTSPTGAVIRDILHRLADRFPRHVLVWPVLVQGDGASAQITAAINGFQTLENKPDLLIVARGGGSLEDLMAFNEEEVVRAIANSSIPVISAVGHETDTTLADFAADLRAPTPTGAAEMAVPVRADLMAQILDDEQRLVSGMNRLLTEQRQKIETLAAKLGDPTRLLETQTQRLDHLSEKLKHIFTGYLETKRRPLIESAARLRHPQEKLNDATKTLTHLGKMLKAYSFENTLQRGFSVIRDNSGKLIADAGHVKNGQALDIQFRNDGHVHAIATSGEKKPPTKSKKSQSSENQQSLFE